MADEDRPVEKKIKDFTAIVAEKVPEYVKAGKTGGKKEFEKALEDLLALEKKTRLAADMDSTKEVAVAIVNLCFDKKEWATLNDHVSLLCKRRAQFTKVMQATIQTAYAFVDQTPNKETKVKLIEALRVVSAGKIFVELESARLTRTLAEIHEADGKLEKAAEVAQEISVETCGSMEMREKTEFLLYQVKLCLETKDFVRTEIIAKKIKPEKLDTEELSDLKLSYLALMIEFHTHMEKHHLETSQCYESMFRTKSIEDDQDEGKWRTALARSAFFVALAPWDHDSEELINRLKVEKKMELLPSFTNLLTALTTREIIRWPLKTGTDWVELLGEDLLGGERGKGRADTLHVRVQQHNIRVCAQFYNRMHTARLAQLLQLDEDKTESILSEMVSNKQLNAKMDRCAGVVVFKKKPTANQVLSEWSGDIASLLSKLETTCHLINKENMLHGIKA